MADRDLAKIISYPVGEDGSLGVARDEITTGLMSALPALAIAGGRVYVVDYGLDKIISYPVEEDGKLGAARDEITTDLSPRLESRLRADGYMWRPMTQGFSNIISYPVGRGRRIGRGAQ